MDTACQLGIYFHARDTHTASLWEEGSVGLPLSKLDIIEIGKKLVWVGPLVRNDNTLRLWVTCYEVWRISRLSMFTMHDMRKENDVHNGVAAWSPPAVYTFTPGKASHGPPQDQFWILLVEQYTVRENNAGLTRSFVISV